MTLTVGYKIAIAFALVISAIVDLLFFIGGGAAGSRIQAYAGLVFGGLGLVCCIYSFYLLTKVSLEFWQVVIMVFACLPLLLMIVRRALN